jgi:hypothetical protein
MSHVRCLFLARGVCVRRLAFGKSDQSVGFPGVGRPTTYIVKAACIRRKHQASNKVVRGAGRFWDKDNGSSTKVKLRPSFILTKSHVGQKVLCKVGNLGNTPIRSGPIARVVSKAEDACFVNLDVVRESLSGPEEVYVVVFTPCLVTLPAQPIHENDVGVSRAFWLMYDPKTKRITWSGRNTTIT